MSLLHLIGLAVAAMCFIIGSVSYRRGYSAGHRAGLADPARLNKSPYPCPDGYPR